MLDVDDLLGPEKKPRKKLDVDDLLGPVKRKRKKAVRKYEALRAPKTPNPDGIFALREKKGKNLGKTCLICNTTLKYKSGRPPVICDRGACFRAYRNAYRADYDVVRA